MNARRRITDTRPVRLYAAVVVANYVAQVVYALHLYGMAFSGSGAALLGATLVWFVAALALCRAGQVAGYWLLLGYASVQSLFYVNSEVILAFAGYGLPYHLVRTQDAILWLTFLVGDLNFVAAMLIVVYLVWNRRSFEG